MGQTDDTVHTVSFEIWMSNKTSHLITSVAPSSQISMQPTSNVKQEINWWHIPFSHSLYRSPQAGNIVCQEPLRKSRSSSKMQCNFWIPITLKLLCNIAAYTSYRTVQTFSLMTFLLFLYFHTVWTAISDAHVIYVCVRNTMSICLTSVMCFYVPQVAKGKAPHVWVINLSKVYWRNHVIKWVSYFHSTYLPTTADRQSWISKCLPLIFSFTKTIANRAPEMPLTWHWNW